MGCCLSAPQALQDETLQGKSASRDTNSRAPPPCVEEEKVKRVLSSETPKPTIPVALSPRPISKASHFDNADSKAMAHKGDARRAKDLLSEDCYSENTASELSSSTVTHDLSYDEERDREKTERRKVAARRRPEWNAGPGKERAIGKSPTRRSEHLSPARRVTAGGGSVRMVGNRVPRKVLKFEGEGREGGDSGPLDRRSRSPAANRSATGNLSSNPRRASQSPAPARRAETGDKNLGNSNANDNDSLDNPVVSLECFIFL